MKTNQRDDDNRIDENPPPTDAGFCAAPVLDVDDYLDDLDDQDLSEEQKIELLETLWNIMAAFVDIGWGVDNVQLVFPELFNQVAQDSQKLLDSDSSQILIEEKGNAHD